MRLSQTDYINCVLPKFNMEDAKPISAPLANHFHFPKDQHLKHIKKENSCLKFHMFNHWNFNVRYGLYKAKHYHVVGVVSRLMSNPGKTHWEVVKLILRYLQGIIEKCLYFSKGELKVQGCVDVDFRGEVDN